MVKKAEKENAMLPLDVARDITLKSARRAFTYHTRRITGADWLAYFQNITHQVIQEGGQREQIFESDSALLELVNAVLTGVDGYGDLASKEWKLSLPVKHRLAVGIALRSVGTAQAKDTAPSLCDLVEARLDATWPTGGKTLLYSGLVHRFRQPSIADLKRFNFESSRVKVVGTAGDGITIYPARQAIAMKIYDDLIESVDGYSIDGKPLEGAEAIKREMDGAHKAAAALDIFLGNDDVTIQ